jgi:DNA-binding beta-propeller fold protein YncE
LFAAIADLHSQPQPAPNTASGSKPDTSLYYWHPPKTNHQRFTNVWTTIAGTAAMPGNHDGTNDEARFNQPVGLAMDKAGHLFVADAFNHTIRRMSQDGSKWIVTTIAGTPGLSGSSDGTNGAARFNQPTGIAIDDVGILFVTDTLNDTIRRIVPMGTNWIVTTIAGMARTNGFLDGTNRVARFNRPLGIAADRQGILYVADSFNHTIREIRHVETNWVVKTIAGSPLSPGKADGVRLAARFHQPAGITLDSAGNLYVADELNETIRKLQLAGTNWVVSTIAGFAGMRGSADGTLSWARFGTPCAISIDAATNLYVTDSGNSNIRRMTPSGTNWLVSTLGGWAGAIGTNDGPGTDARFYCPCGIAVNAKGNHYYIADSLNNTIRAGGGAVTVTNIILGRWEKQGGGVNFNRRGFYIRAGSRP